MESIYWVLSWACHRRCVHCYDDRFRPYRGAALEGVVQEGEAAVQRIAAHLPPSMAYRDPRDPEGAPDRVGQVILAGGEVLLEPVYNRVFLPALDALNARYPKRGVRLSMQTTGDRLKPAHIEAMLARNIWMIAIAGMDDYHVGMEQDRRGPLMEKIRAMMAAAGVEEVTLGGRGRDYTREPGPFFLFFGADPKSWIGELWPRGRAWSNGLSTAGNGVNFCARHSGGLGFLNVGLAGSEVAIEPDGSLYPCCLKTKAPLGNVAEEPLLAILDSYRGHPAFEAINRGDPEAMGETYSVDRAAFQRLSETTDAKGQPYTNPCIGCDRFFEQRLGGVIAAISAARRAKAPS